MNIDEYKSTIEFIFLYVVFGFVLLFQYRLSFNYEETFLFIELMLTYVWTAGLFVFSKIRFHLNLFEPITIVTVIYECIFVIKPIIDLKNHAMVEHGVSVIEGGPKATLLFTLGFTAFYIAYYMKHRKLTYKSRLLYHSVDEPIKPDPVRLRVLYVMWVVVFALCIYCMITQGLSLQYIFSFGSEGVRVSDSDNTALLFLANFGVTLATIWLMILVESKNLAIKVIITVLCVIYVLMRNARWLMLVFIVAPVAMYYLKKRKQPRFLLVVLIGVVGLTVFAWMQVNRSTLYSGGAMGGWGDKGFSPELLLSPMETDFSTYRAFYSMVTRYPSQYDYMMGITFLYSLVIMIPRALWPSKPDNPVRDMIEHSLSKTARISGTAVANIGEYYANFGVIGIIACMFIFGRITSWLKLMIFDYDKRWDTRQRTDMLVMYSIMFPLLFQWIARGNFSGNLYLTFFAVLPFVFYNIFESIRRKRNI